MVAGSNIFRMFFSCFYEVEMGTEIIGELI